MGWAFGSGQDEKMRQNCLLTPKQKHGCFAKPRAPEGFIVVPTRYYAYVQIIAGKAFGFEQLLHQAELEYGAVSFFAACHQVKSARLAERSFAGKRVHLAPRDPVRGRKNARFAKDFWVAKEGKVGQQAAHGATHHGCIDPAWLGAKCLINERLEVLDDKLCKFLCFSCFDLRMLPSGVLPQAVFAPIVYTYDDNGKPFLEVESVQRFVHMPFARKASLGIKEVLCIVHVDHRVVPLRAVIVWREVNPDCTRPIQGLDFERLGQDIYIRTRVGRWVGQMQHIGL